jgi:hypothetical protein
VRPDDRRLETVARGGLSDYPVTPSQEPDSGRRSRDGAREWPGCRLPTLSKDALIMRLIPVVVLLLLPFVLGGCVSFSSSSPPPPASNTTIIAPPGTTPGRY